ncbi:unnamed protein product [Urochloa decumbens]|uniref:NB-ARC domain-containing protein n=1 Tax=Urochloa decumbens TaxID=240449 RepID=A0ABC9AZZ8_9POAL
MFIHASEIFRVDKIFRDMLSEMSKGQQSDTKCVTALRDELKEEMKGKRFLLVLDDLWVNDENQRERDILLNTLKAGQCGSRILVTARREDAAAALGSQEQIPIPYLEEEQYFSMFMHYALEGTSFDDYERYASIRRKIAKKLCRSPIAAITVAARLKGNKRISFWESTANDDVLNKTMGALWWSYQQLGADIRRCFAYCSTFPRGYYLKRDELIRIWTAQGFIKTRTDPTDVWEDVGQHYFDELLTFSFLQVQRTIIGTETEAFTIHDLLHELAERVAGNDFHRIDLNGSLNEFLPGVRHVFIDTSNGPEIPEKYLDFENLRTLIIKEHWTDTDRLQPMEVMKRNHDLEKVFERLFMRMRKLQVLIVELNPKTEALSVPTSIDQMKHRGYELKQLKHLNKLRGTLEINGLGIVGSKEEALEAHLTRKKGLTKLEMSFSCGWNRDQDIEAEVLEGLCPPEDLQELANRDQDIEAAVLLEDLQELANRDQDIEAAVLLEDLQELANRDQDIKAEHPDAPKCLQTLEISWCSRLASIPEDSVLFKRLLELRIKHCDWGSLPENMECLVSLQTLIIVGCNKMEFLPTLPQSLLKIDIIQCGVLSTTCQEEGHENWQKIQHIPEKRIL